MEVKEQIFEILRTDYSLRKKIADDLGLRETTVTSWAYRKQHAKVGFYTVANIIKDHTGLTDKDIFEPTVVVNQ
ncbi:hypothetical protein OX284_007730 [Flavobacterium sp. SUN046]|uniref:hypothetical protein n=1 Tax=Flavobacterium sp. SUN046 TaxID=3002440 RepID=UPI002DBBC35A|nr:hypothetical protein [Flavobacterium sp. SUN046]MEC4049317.1 hypothetical protein [Flavobacterium sp. SUN046]